MDPIDEAFRRAVEKGKEEMSAEWRRWAQSAKRLWQRYLFLVALGFDRYQAFDLLLRMIDDELAAVLFGGEE